MEATTPTTITCLNNDTTTQEVRESQTSIVDGGVVTLNENDADVHSVMALMLPKHVVIQSTYKNSKYLHLRTENTIVTGALRFDGDYSYDLDTRFEVVPATNGTGLVHIRSLLNSKYWTKSDAIGHSYVTATAVKPEENQADKQCTLFRPIFWRPENNHFVRLLHVSTGTYVAFFVGTGDSDGLLCLTNNEDESYTMCTFLDWESIVVLPDLIRIKGVKNGNHLRAFEDGFMDYNNKADNSSVFDFEVSPSRDGGIRLKSSSFGKYWMDMDNSDWVLLMQDSSTVHDIKTVFHPIIVGGNRVIIRSYMTNYCNMHSADSKNNCLATLHPYPDEWSYMEIEEPVVSRKIDNVRYRLDDARIYDQKNVALISDDSSNKTKYPLTSEIDLTTTVSNTTNWSTSVSMKVGVEMSVTFGIPIIKSGSGEIEISGEKTKSSEWGETETASLQVGSVKTIVVPSMTRLKTSLMETRSSYVIPFSYTQRDLLENGFTKVTDKNDGYFTGKNGYGYRYEVVQLPLE